MSRFGQGGSSSFLNLYYKEASKYSLLSRSEEIDLFRKMYKWSKNKSKCGSSDRRVGKEARTTLINSNLRLVIKIAKQFTGLGLDLSDLINEGNIGLIRGVDKYDLTKGAKLSHYSGFWIKQTIMRALANTGRTIRIPAGAVQQKIKISRFTEEFEKKHGRKPSLEEIGKALKLKKERIIILSDASLTVSSLNSKVSRNDGCQEEIGDFIPDPRLKSPDEIIKIKSDNAVLEKCLSKLTLKERHVIEKRFGLGPDLPETLERIGEDFGLTRERIRQIEFIAMRKLRLYIKKEFRK